jgi:tetratricopeptide (TPR) repeat protein
VNRLVRLLPPFVLIAAIAGPGVSFAAGTAAKPAPTTSASPAPTATLEPLDIAIPRLEKAIKDNPSDNVSMSQLAVDYLNVGRPDLAVALTQKLLASGTKTAQVYYFDGVAQQNLGHVKESIESFENAANLEPTNMGILAMLSSAYLRTGRGADAERVAKRALTFNKDVPDAYENYGGVFASEKKYDEAREQYEAAAKLAPKDPHPVVLEARTYLEQQAVALADGLADRALSIAPTDLESLALKAQIAADRHDVKTAIATFEKILPLEKDDASKAAVVVEMARLYVREKMDTDAAAAFQRALKDYPGITSTHVVYGDYFIAKNDKDAATREYTAALGANNDNPDALSRLGDLAMASKDYTGAVDRYKRLVAVVPNDPRPLLSLAQAYLASENFTAARDAFRQSYAIDRTPDALVGLADADYESKNYTEAIQILEALDKQVPELIKSNPILLLGLGKNYQAVNQSQKARDAYSRLLAMMDPASPSYKDVKKLIDDIDHASPSVAPSSKPSAKPSAKPSPKPTTSH